MKRLFLLFMALFITATVIPMAEPTAEDEDTFNQFSNSTLREEIDKLNSRVNAHNSAFSVFFHYLLEINQEITRSPRPLSSVSKEIFRTKLKIARQFANQHGLNIQNDTSIQELENLIK